MLKRRFPSITSLVTWLIIALGVILRMRQYLAIRSLWLDEAMLALNIVHRNYIGLFQPLDYNQGAPIGFLLLEKFVITLLGNNELRLRLVPLMAGCASLVFYYLFLKNNLSPFGTITALSLFAVSPTLVYYSSEVKQYSSDVFITIFILWLTFGINFGRECFDPSQPANNKHLKILTLALVGALSLWFSHPSLFLLAAIGLILVIQSFITPNWKNRIWILGLGVVWLMSLGVLYFVNLSSLSLNAFLIDYWQGSFLPQNHMLIWVRDAFMSLFKDPAGLDEFSPVLLIITMIGMANLFSRHWQIAASISLTFGFVLIASALQKYPFTGRLMLFAVPLLFFLLGSAVDWLFNLPLKPRFLLLLISIFVAGWMLYNPTLVSSDNFITPRYNEHIRPAMAYLQKNYKPGDVIYVYYWTVPAFYFYTPYYGFSENDFIAGKQPDLASVTMEISQLDGNSRVWVIFSHLPPNGVVKKDKILDSLNHIGQLKQKFIKPGTNVFLYLYDLSPQE
jgi:hypothetical protein